MEVSAHATGDIAEEKYGVSAFIEGWGQSGAAGSAEEAGFGGYEEDRCDEDGQVVVSR